MYRVPSVWRSISLTWRAIPSRVNFGVRNGSDVRSIGKRGVCIVRKGSCVFWL